MATMKTGGAATKTRAAAGKKQSDNRKKWAERAAILLKQISDPTRLRIIGMLSDGERNVGSMCDELGQTQPAVSHHLAIMRHSGIVVPRRQGKNNFYTLTGTGDGLAKIVNSMVD